VLCHERGLSVSAAMNILGVSSGNMTHWRKGRLPKGDTLRRMARFFDVPVDTLIGSKQENLAVQQEKLLLLFESAPKEKRAQLQQQFADRVEQTKTP
jgi:transcriptional regulator with XRE-family HTH domain